MKQFTGSGWLVSHSLAQPKGSFDETTMNIEATPLVTVDSTPGILAWSWLSQCCYITSLCGVQKASHVSSLAYTALIPVMVKMDSPKLVPQNWFSKIGSPGTNFLINKDPPELILLQNMDSIWKIWTTSQRWNNVDSGTYLTCKTWTSGVCRRFLETTQACQVSNTQCTVVSFLAARKSHFLRKLCKVCDEHKFRTLHGGAEAY